MIVHFKCFNDTHADDLSDSRIIEFEGDKDYSEYLDKLLDEFRLVTIEKVVRH